MVSLLSVIWIRTEAMQGWQNNLMISIRTKQKRIHIANGTLGKDGKERNEKNQGSSEQARKN